MKRTTFALALLCSSAGLVGAFELPPEIAMMTAAEYNELSMFVRSETMQPIAEAAGIPYIKLNACLKAAAGYPQYRNWKMPRATAGCIQLVKEVADD